MTIPGVQPFISESRTTADLHTASRLMSLLTARMVEVAESRGEVVLPARPVPEEGESPESGTTVLAAAGLPNRVTALAAAGQGRELARAMADATTARWRELVAEHAGAAATSGFPAPQWVVAPGVTAETYRTVSDRAGVVLAARKRTKDFPAYASAGHPVCGLSGRWASTGRDRLTGEELSTVARVKRSFRWSTREGFPSTPSVASAHYRSRIVTLLPAHPDLRRAVDELQAAVAALVEADGRRRPPGPSGRSGITAGITAGIAAGIAPGGAAAPRSDVVGRIRRGRSDLPGLARLGAGTGAAGEWLATVEGAWIYPETWDPLSLAGDFGLAYEPDATLCRTGHQAAQAVVRAAGDAGAGKLTPYLAIVVQDADRMGEAMSRPAARIADVNLLDWHRNVSRMLVRLAADQSHAVASPELLGRAVYAGGDDLLCFLPAATALTAAGRVNEMFVDTASELVPGLTASTAVVYFHASTALATVVQTAQELLHQAKERERPGLGVAVLRRGGERARVVLPWRLTGPGQDGGTTSLSVLSRLVSAYSEGLSPRLAWRLETDRVALAALPSRWREWEIARLMGRHGAPSEDIIRLLSALAGDALAGDALAGDTAAGGVPADDALAGETTADDAATGPAPESGVATDLALVARFIDSEALGAGR